MTGHDVRRRAVLAGLGTAAVTSAAIGRAGGTADGVGDGRLHDRQPGVADGVLYVAPDGADDQPGTDDEPLGTIQEAVERIEPGGVVYVTDGEYQENVVVEASGTPEQPIEITGPPSAVLRRAGEVPAAMVVLGDHVHLTGLTLDGLVDPDRPEDPAAYGDAPVLHVTGEVEDYAEGLVLAPHGIGNSGRQLVNLNFVAGAEVGPFEVTGRAGAKWQLTDEEHHNGEVVYIGTAVSTMRDHDDLPDWDLTHDVHVHHVDNSAGHPHAQLVEIKPGVTDVTVEYCTDGGGSHNTVDWPSSCIGLAGHRCTIRWCRLQDGAGNGISVGQSVDVDDEVADTVGTENEIYRNEITGFEDAWAIAFSPGAAAGQDPDDQAMLCGNTVEGAVEGDPEVACPEEIPEGTGIGVDGGDVEAARAAIVGYDPTEDLETDSIADVALYGATAVATGGLFVPYLLRRYRGGSR